MTSAGGSAATYERRWWTLAVLCLSLLIVGLDTSILNVALPTLVRQVGASTSQLQWIIDSYVVVFAGLLLVMGSVADQRGRKGVLTVGLVVFGTASAAAATTTTSNQFIACRAVMGVGAAMIMPATLSILANVFTDPRERRRAIAYWSLMSAAGTTVGPIAGGLLLRRFWWGSVFLVNVPIVIFAIIAGHRLVPTSRSPHPTPLDLPGAALSTAGLSVLLWAIISGPERGWTSGSVLLGFALAAVLIAGFAMWELHTDDPMLELRFFRDMRLTAASASIAIGMVSLTGVMFLFPQLLQFVKGYTPLSAGIHVAIPLLVTNLLVMPMSPRLTERYGPKVMVTSGLIASAGGLAMVAGFTRVATGYPNLLAGLLLIGIGFSLFLPSATDAIIATLPATKSGSGSAINQTSRQVGQAMGVALAGSLAVSGFRATVAHSPATAALPPDIVERARESIAGSYRVAEGLSVEVQRPFLKLVDLAFVNGVRLSALVAAGIAVLGAAFAAWALPNTLPAHEATELEPEPADLGREPVGLEPAPTIIT